MIAEYILVTVFYVNGQGITNQSRHSDIKKCLDAQAEYSDNLPDDREPIAYCIPVIEDSNKLKLDIDQNTLGNSPWTYNKETNTLTNK